MKNKLMVLALTAALVSVAGCKQAPSPGTVQDTTKTAMQKKYTNEADCKKDFPQAGDCVRQTTTAAGAGAVGGHGGFFMSPFFYPWGAVMHNNGTTSYNSRVPTSGYAPAPLSSQGSLAKRADFARAPRASSFGSSNSVRGGFGSSARSSGYATGG